jgi:hypothetical protein
MIKAKNYPGADVNEACMHIKKWLFIFCFYLSAVGVCLQAQAKSIEEIMLVENGSSISLYANGTCSLDKQANVVVRDASAYWQDLIAKPYIDSLSGIAILEQVKQEMQKTRILVDIDNNSPTELIIKYTDKTKNISLYSVDMLYQTYPNAILLSNFINFITQLRKAQADCKEVDA